MKLYYHYKNKPYKYLGTAKHSETLEDLVVYETLHKNDLATLWVRPQEMFHELLEHDGQSQPRFRPARFEISETFRPTKEDLQNISHLVKHIFSAWDEISFQQKLETHKNFYLLTAKVEDQIVGFKLGYELNPTVFYSWVGGLLPEFRGLGLGSALMKRQHEWCRQQGYNSVQTKTQNHYPEMLILNLKQGFQVVGTENTEKGLKILLQKTL